MSEKVSSFICHKRRFAWRFSNWTSCFAASRARKRLYMSGAFLNLESSRIMATFSHPWWKESSRCHGRFRARSHRGVHRYTSARPYKKKFNAACTKSMTCRHVWSVLRGISCPCSIWELVLQQESHILLEDGAYSKLVGGPMGKRSEDSESDFSPVTQWCRFMHPSRQESWGTSFCPLLCNIWNGGKSSVTGGPSMKKISRGLFLKF